MGQIREEFILADEFSATFSRFLQMGQGAADQLTVLDRFGNPDPDYPPIPQVRSRKQFQQGTVVAAALPYGELTPSIIGEARL